MTRRRDCVWILVRLIPLVWITSNFVTKCKVLMLWPVQTVNDVSSMYLLKWWAHQDLNLGPKDYEQPQEIKPQWNQEVTCVLQGCGSKCGSIISLLWHGQLPYRTWAQSIWAQVVNDVIGNNCKYCLQYVPLKSGGPTWTRTRDQRIMSSFKK